MTGELTYCAFLAFFACAAIWLLREACTHVWEFYLTLPSDVVEVILNVLAVATFYIVIFILIVVTRMVFVPPIPQ